MTDANFVEDDFDQFINTTLNEDPEELEESSSDGFLLKKIRDLGSQEKMSMASNIFHHYEELRRKHLIDQDLFDMAVVVLSAPATQVSVERAFSALALILQPHRLNLKASVVNDLLVCALNKHLFSLIDFESMTPN